MWGFYDKYWIYLFHFVLLIICATSNTNNAHNRKASLTLSTPNSDSITFPDTKKLTPTECYGGFCNKVENYPYEEMDHLIKMNPLLADFFGTPDIHNRGAASIPDSSEETLCAYNIIEYGFEWALNTNNVNRTLIQGSIDKQTIKAEVCAPNANCKFKSSFPNNYRVFCKQKFLKKRLYCLSENKTIISDLFNVPCCCVCAYEPIQFD